MWLIHHLHKTNLLQHTSLLYQYRTIQTITRVASGIEKENTLLRTKRSQTGTRNNVSSLTSYRRKQLLRRFLYCPLKTKKIKIGQFISPPDLIYKKIPGTYKMKGDLMGALCDTLKPVIFPKISCSKDHINKLTQQYFEKQILHEKELLKHECTIYVNPICLKTDQLLMRSESIQDILSLLISHRGTFFVYNLVTAIQLIAILSCKLSTPDLCRLHSDERFELFLSDLREKSSHFDAIASTNIILSLQRLQLKNYLVFNSLIRPLFKDKKYPQSTEEVLQIVRAVQAYRWCGYNDGNIYQRFSEMIEQCTPYLTKLLLLESCKILSSLTYHPLTFFQTIQTLLLNTDCPFNIVSESSMSNWTPNEIARLCQYFTRDNHQNYDHLLSCINNHLLHHMEKYNIREIITCIQGFKTVNLSFKQTALLATSRVRKYMQRIELLRQPMTDLTIPRLCFFIEALAFFRFDSIEVIKLIKSSCNYLEDYIDYIPELSALRLAWSISVYNLTGEFSYLLFFLYRKLGRTIGWEKDKLRCFQLWISQQLQFPDLEYSLPPHVLYESYREWCLHQGGFRISFIDEVEEISRLLQEFHVEHVVQKEIPNSPYTIDIAFEQYRKGIIVTNHCSRNDSTPSGISVVKLTHLRQLGWNCSIISQPLWKQLPTSKLKHQHILSLLEDMSIPTILVSILQGLITT